ncbi:pilus assembly protein [Kitasatospora saccharophila]|uniref:Pilus assembly protein n=1 Tax=Kitasatospora saccharophila TaxID=407973 RepID=A0ABN2X6S5_9ACTN
MSGGGAVDGVVDGAAVDGAVDGGGALRRPPVRRRRRGLRDRGSFAVEAALLVPVILTFALMAVAAGRLQTTGAVVDAAARAGARAASLSHSREGAQQAARDAVAQALAVRQVRCETLSLQDLEYRPLTVGGETLTTVVVQVSCEVPLADLTGLDRLPGSKTLTGTFSSVLDRYRETD